jgi:hypothetical protein
MLEKQVEPEVKENINEVGEESETSFLDMSDEELMNAAPPEINLEEESDEEDGSNTDSGIDDETEESGEERSEESAEEDSEEDSEEEEEEAEADKEKIAAKDTHKDAPETKETEDESPKQKIDYKAEYEKIMAPFKANGKIMALDKAEDVIQLMSMGANYNQKMRAMKPHLKVIKMLDNNNLLDESKLSYLIDLDKKNPEAITKLLKDSGIDPLNVDIEEDSKYKTHHTYTVGDNELDLDNALAEIRQTSTYNETVDIISNKWDEPSRRIIINDPNIIPVLNEQVASGLYAQITDTMDRERALGRLNGLTDIEAYKQIGANMLEQAALQKQTIQQNQLNAVSLKATNSTSKKTNPELNKRKQAAGGTKQAPGGNKKSDFDPLSMTDAEFEKLSVDDLF